MDVNQVEITAAEEGAPYLVLRNELVELSDLQLALIGGGIGETIL